MKAIQIHNDPFLDLGYTPEERAKVIEEMHEKYNARAITREELKAASQEIMKKYAPALANLK